MEVSDVAKMPTLEDENCRLKKLLADSALEIDALKLIASENSDARAAATNCSGVMDKIGLSQRKACAVATCNCKTFRRVLCRTDDAALLQRLHELAAEKQASATTATIPHCPSDGHRQGCVETQRHGALHVEHPR
jgi:hypothetical protein